VKADPVANELMSASPERVLGIVMHEAATMHMFVSKELCRHPELIPTRPSEFAVLLNALTASNLSLPWGSATTLFPIPQETAIAPAKRSMSCVPRSTTITR